MEENDICPCKALAELTVRLAVLEEINKTLREELNKKVIECERLKTKYANTREGRYEELGKLAKKMLQGLEEELRDEE